MIRDEIEDIARRVRPQHGVPRPIVHPDPDTSGWRDESPGRKHPVRKESRLSMSRDHAPDLDAQMESISGGGLPRRAEMAFEGLSWSFVRFGATSVDLEVHRRDRRPRC